METYGLLSGAGVAQSVQCLTTDWTTGVRSRTEAEDFSSSLCVQTGSGAHPASYPVGTGGSFSGGKARPGRDADHSPPSSADVKYGKELYLLSPLLPPWRVAGHLCFLPFIIIYTTACHWAHFNPVYSFTPFFSYYDSVFTSHLRLDLPSDLFP
jgi:hypothetical protein